MCNRDIDALREEVKRRLSEKRFNHTLGVERMAVLLGEMLLPHRIFELRSAALLHDVAKEMTHDEMRRLILDEQINVSAEDLATLPALHSFAGVAVIKKCFPDFASHDILSAVKNHTLGAPDMSLFDKIVYISDYVEDGRTHASCQRVRMELLQTVSSTSERDALIKALNSAIIKSIDFTIQHLESIKAQIHSSTIDTKNALLPLI